jgi:predicted dehydrogenase
MEMAQDKVRFGIIGVGRWAGKLAGAVERSGEAEVVTGFSRTEETRKAFEKEVGCRSADSLDALLADDEVEGVLIVTPHSTHADIIVQAASAGKHVFVEKPLSLTVESGKRAVEAAEKAGVVLQVGHNRRRLGATRRLREMIDAGELGMVHQLEANITNANGQVPRQGWRNDPGECPIGGMTALGVHKIDNFHYLAGPIKRVFAFSKKLFAGGELDDVSIVGMEFESGPLGYLQTSIVVPAVISTCVYGTEASAWSDEDGTKLYVQKKDEAARSELPVKGGDALADEFAEFARCIRGGGRPEVGGAEGVEVVAVVEAIIESVNTGRAVEVSNFR